MEDISYHDIKADLIDAAIRSGVLAKEINSIIRSIETECDKPKSRLFMKSLAAVYDLLINLPKNSKITMNIRTRLQAKAFLYKPPQIEEIHNAWFLLNEYQKALSRRVSEESRIDVSQLKTKLREVSIRHKGRIITLTVRPSDVLIFPRRNSKPGKFRIN